MARILITSRSFGTGARDLVGLLASEGHEVSRRDSAHDLDDLAPVLAQTEAWIAGTGEITADHLAAAPRLRVVARYGVGTEAVDLEAAAACGVTVTNTPGANSEAVADHAMALMLSALRSVADGDRRLRAGDWSTVRARQLRALNVAVIGFGRIGRGVTQRLRGFGSTVLAVDPMVDDRTILAAGARRSTLAQARDADVVTLHAPGGEVLIDDDWLRGASSPVLLVNTARADLIDEAALAAALHDGLVTAFAADTLAGDTAAMASPLLDAGLKDRVTLTPHLGAQTVEAVDAMGIAAVDSVRTVLSGNSPRHVVIPQPAGGSS